MLKCAQDGCILGGVFQSEGQRISCDDFYRYVCVYLSPVDNGQPLRAYPCTPTRHITSQIPLPRNNIPLPFAPPVSGISCRSEGR